MEPFTRLRAVAAPMPIDNIDTDAITPSAAGKSTSVDLGAMLFNNSRYHLDGAENPDFVLNVPKYRKSQILVAGRNFGCGSSRERAVWALMRFGIRCVIAPSFADIFYDNSFQNGLLPVTLPEADWRALLQSLEGDAAVAPEVNVDLVECKVQGPNGEFGFVIPAERRMALLEGLDEIDVILRFEKDMDEFEQRDRIQRPWNYGVPFAAARSDLAGSQK
jgi:3-isopropylmalate/(R)-2-methylmalate dehydratase small subunit